MGTSENLFSYPQVLRIIFLCSKWGMADLTMYTNLKKEIWIVLCLLNKLKPDTIDVQMGRGGGGKVTLLDYPPQKILNVLAWHRLKMKGSLVFIWLCYAWNIFFMPDLKMATAMKKSFLKLFDRLKLGSSWILISQDFNT